MIYINDTDLKADSFERFILESANDEPDTISKNELRSIEIIKTYLSGRYNTEKIFNPDNPLRNELLVDITCKIILYKIFRRNAARKLPADIKEDYTWAINQLEKINTGRIALHDLPIQESSPGKPVSSAIWGNNSNKDFYI
ncbi:DUF1320 domain-containing protein [Chitinophaga sp. SYP-B3965]|uniref:phage protein Gp36 family protein n=1 Tax=Chitinophaga sp. SYP-B3965 TaxID=2663120 RepID=UPI0012995BB1|nr:phage protein Gp36 family protein [Chitinophaga sp. SYP-B3965]MRG45510.1 DUF1320 domain-containing protein [Chitinophaga sp. SYP-B3965]